MYEIHRLSGVDFITRRNSVDVENLKWVVTSPFIKKLTENNLSPDDCVLDLGSHIGAFSLLAARKFGCKVFAFEPERESFTMSRASAILNELDELISFRQYAIGGFDGSIDFYESDQTWGHTIIKGGGPANVLTGVVTKVTQLSFDSVVSSCAGKSRLFVKFNIEGAEFDMFRDATKEALQKVDVLVGEVHYDLGLGDFSVYVQRIADAGFSVDLVPEGENRDILYAKKILPCR